MTHPSSSILLVEDRQDEEELTLLALQRAGIGHVDVARDGEQALAYLHHEVDGALRPLPAVVLLDLHLPKVDGLEVLRRIRSDDRTRILPTVMFSASQDPSDVERAYALGANSFVSKPAEFSRFESAVQQMGRYWTELNEIS